MVFAQLCISAALIAIFLLCSTWSNFFDDLFNFMNSNTENLMAGLEILDAFATELDQVILDRKKLMRIKCLILEQIPQKFIELFEFLMINPADPTSLEKTLHTLKSWTSIKLQIFQYSEKITELLLGFFETGIENRMELISEIICEALKGSIHADILESTNFVNAEKLITQNERVNINKIVEFLGVRHLERFMQSLKSAQSIIARPYAEILTVLAEKFIIFILENTEFSHAIIKLLIMTTSHSSLSISHLTFEFWVSFYQIAHKNLPNIKSSNCDYLIVPFVDLFKIVLEKCKLRSFKLKSKELMSYHSPKKQKAYQMNENQEEPDTVALEEDEEENEGNKITLASYRRYSEDIFYNIYRILSEFREEQGTQLFFALVRERLGKEFYLTTYAGLNEAEISMEYVLTIEATLFAVKSMLDNIIFTNSNPYIHEILKCVITQLPYEGIVVKTALQLIYDASEQLKFSLEILEDVYKYVLQFIVDQRLGKLASQVFFFFW